MQDSSKMEPEEDEVKPVIVNGHIEYMTDEEYRDYLEEKKYDFYDSMDPYYSDEDFGI